MDEALVEHAEHDVDGDDGGEDQEQLVAEGRLEGERRTLEARAARSAAGRSRSRPCGWPRPRRRGRRRRARLNDTVVAGNWPRWLISSGDSRSMTLRPAPTAAPGRRRPWRRAGRWCRAHRGTPCSEASASQDDAVLVRLREDRRDDALAEGVVERVVDRGGGDAEAAGGVAVDREVGGQPVRPAGRWPRPRAAAAAAGAPRSFGTQVVELVQVRVLEHELVLGAARPSCRCVRSCTGCM